MRKVDSTSRIDGSNSQGRVMSNFHGIRAAMRLMAAAGLSLLVTFGASAQTVRYIHTDALGSAVFVTDKDRNVVELSEYEPYGNLLNRSVTDGPGYTGHVADAATGLTYMQQRYYDPGIGRALSVDPVAANPKNGAGFNRYSYAANNPYKFTDPDGRCEAPTGTLICSRLADAAKSAVANYAAKKMVQLGNAVVTGVKTAVKENLNNNTYSVQVGLSGTIAAPLIPGTIMPSTGVGGQLSLAVSHRGQVSLTLSGVPLAGAGGGGSGGLSYGASAAEGGASPTGFSISQNHHVEAGVSLPEIPVALGGNVDWTDKGASLGAGSAKFSAGQIMFVGGGEQVNVTYTFNEGVKW
ncbi:RHS repeat-associated core domain-containing protein [Xanthomonas sacchari]